MNQILENLYSILDLSQFRVPHIGINSIIDITAVTIVTYALIIWVRQTRAWSLFKGVLILSVIAMASYLFDLYAVFWIVSSAFSIGILAIVIIFQPELRRALEQLGRSRFYLLDDDKTHIDERTADEITSAVFELSEAQTGALILIECDVPLGEYESTGVRLDALVSAKLICSIFVDTTPLHDGAATIRGARVGAAGCILPLTSQELDENMGTRHRAAIGASEASDALVIVVSEETGIVSAALGGRLERRLDPEGVRSRIMESSKRQSSKDTIKEHFRKGRGEK